MHCGHRQIEHTADIALEIWAPDEVQLLLEGARAIVKILSEDADVAASAERFVSLDALDAEDRLVQWLNEIVVLAVTEGFLFTRARIKLSDTGLEAQLAGEAGASDRIKTELKAVTYHDLALLHEDDRVFARVVVDV